MNTPCFFGYGSLVNRATHDYPNAQPARAAGWRRAWRHTDLRPFAFLTATRCAQSRIDGLIADVPGADWAALDEREHAYDRITDTGNIHHARPDRPEIAIYAVPEAASRSVTERHPILLSYLDVVIQGYLREFGAAGAAAFFDTTDGWDAPILDDRAAPLYPRHQTLAPDETSYVNNALAERRARIIPAP